MARRAFYNARTATMKTTAQPGRLTEADLIAALRPNATLAPGAMRTSVPGEPPVIDQLAPRHRCSRSQADSAATDLPNANLSPRSAARIGVPRDYSGSGLPQPSGARTPCDSTSVYSCPTCCSSRATGADESVEEQQS